MCRSGDVCAAIPPLRAFKKPSIGKRGYDEEQVDAFLDQLEQELIRLIEATALDEMTAQLGRVQREKASAEQAARATQAELEQVRTRSGPMAAHDREQASQVLTMAERTADTHLGEAQREAHDVLSDARSTGPGPIGTGRSGG